MNDLLNLIARMSSGPNEYRMFTEMLLGKTIKRCDSCGGKLRGDNKYGACTRYPECRKVHQRRQWRILYGGKPQGVLEGIPGLTRIA